MGEESGRSWANLLTMRVLGLDPGTRALGYGLVVAEGQRLVPGSYGVLGAEEQDLSCLLLTLYRQVASLLRQTGPDVVAVEQIFFNRNVRTAAAVLQARGVALLACAEAGVACLEFAPGQVKLAVAANGGADKGQVQSMVCRLLGLDRPPPDDAADALAVAVCAHHHLPLLRAAGGRYP